MDFLTSFLHHLPPETAHHLALKMLQFRGRFLNHLNQKQEDFFLQPKEICGIKFRNIIGLAAGFDKNANAISALFSLGFGSVEVGTITPKPQTGNPSPRLFRLKEDQAIINRLGFNNDGMDVVARRLACYQEQYPVSPGPVGVNIGKNKETKNAAKDYALAAKTLAPYADYLTLNLSSPNTPGLRDLQTKEHMAEILDAVYGTMAGLFLGKTPPVFIKIAPDATDQMLEEIADFSLSRRKTDAPVSALILTNTTLSRPQDLKSPYAKISGGLSGKPLYRLSTESLRKMHDYVQDDIPLIGVGGIASAEDVLEKINAGAQLIQLYTSFIFKGPDLVRNILSSADFRTQKIK